MFQRLLALLVLCVLVPAAHAGRSDPDPAFGTSGWRRMYHPSAGTLDEKAVAFARTADGGYVVALQLPGGGANGGTGALIGLFRLTRKGAFVSTGFGTDGKVFKDAWLTAVTDMTIDAQGRIIVIGPTPGQGGLRDFGIVRFKPDGSDDTSFAGDGGVAYGFDTTVDIDDIPLSVLAEPDGRIVVAGNSVPAGYTSRFSALRVNADGSLDSTWGSIDNGAGGRKGTMDTFRENQPAVAARILSMANGYYLIAGTTTLNANDSDFAARILTPSGSPWASYVGSESFPIDVPIAGTQFDIVYDAVRTSPTTALLVGGASGRSAALRVRIATSGGSSQYTLIQQDTSFVGDRAAGICLYCFVGGAWRATSAAIDATGGILLVGDVSSNTPAMIRTGFVTRLKADGTRDARFGNAGEASVVAPVLGGSGSQSYFTELAGALFDADQPVLLGSAVDSTTSVSDFDGVITRLQGETIFRNGFESSP